MNDEAIPLECYIVDSNRNSPIGMYLILLGKQIVDIQFIICNIPKPLVLARRIKV